MVSCVFPGSFDPVTKGHLDLISRAAGLFDRVTVTVMVNISKKGSIPLEKRLSMLRKICEPYPNVRVDSWNGLLADYMDQENEKIILRGLRSSAEFDHEFVSCSANKLLNSRIETIFLPCDPAMNGISSSAVKEIAAFGGDIRSFVPEAVAEEIRLCLSKNNK
ncbi:MAG: pantetheine-phosphate adenylyltransferase [Clostridia bacterium]|nr:pantetheine-phosphate adenylyltransferase [Clostridia bacterium]